jgi:membrane-associated phospholipid phosphatase
VKTILYDWGGLNVWLFLQINDLHRPWWDHLMLLGTRLGSYTNFTLYLSLAAVAGFAHSILAAREDAARANQRAIAWLGVLAIFAVGYLASGLAVGALKSGFDLPRPLLALSPGSVIVLGEPELKHSFPSGHAEFAMVVTASLWPVLGRSWRYIGAAFVFWVSLSRLSVGAHFPADVVGGCVVGLVIVVPLHMVVTRLTRSAAGGCSSWVRPATSTGPQDPGSG